MLFMVGLAMAAKAVTAITATEALTTTLATVAIATTAHNICICNNNKMYKF